jgi:hypothetical protein
VVLSPGVCSAPRKRWRVAWCASLHAPADLLPAARALAREIADNTAPVSIALTRQMARPKPQPNPPRPARWPAPPGAGIISQPWRAP